MSELADPVCADCVSFTPEQRDEQGRVRGRCRFRPEMGLIRENLPFCHVFQVRRERADKVRVPPPTRKRSYGGRSSASSKPVATTPRRTLRGPTMGDTSGEITMDRNGLKQVLRELLEEETLFGYPEMGQRWDGGTLVIKPGDAETQPKEIPLETFFHKIVMVRDRLRVLEAKINGSDALSPQDKIELQGYVSKCYGTLTTFNALFRNKSDHFSSK